jgi:hypothetical protein
MMQGCDNPTKNAARIKGDGYSITMLCEDHLNPEDAAVALNIDGPANDYWHS